MDLVLGKIVVALMVATNAKKAMIFIFVPMLCLLVSDISVNGTEDEWFGAHLFAKLFFFKSSNAKVWKLRLWLLLVVERQLIYYKYIDIEET